MAARDMRSTFPRRKNYSLYVRRSTTGETYHGDFDDRQHAATYAGEDLKRLISGSIAQSIRDTVIEILLEGNADINPNIDPVTWRLRWDTEIGWNWEPYALA